MLPLIMVLDVPEVLELHTISDQISAKFFVNIDISGKAFSHQKYAMNSSRKTNKAQAKCTESTCHCD